MILFKSERKKNHQKGKNYYIELQISCRYGIWDCSLENLLFSIFEIRARMQSNKKI